MVYNTGITSLSACQITEQVTNGDLTITEVCQSLLERIRTRSNVGAWTHLDPSLVLAQAKDLESDLKSGANHEDGLLGVPVGIKDIFYTKGGAKDFC